MPVGNLSGWRQVFSEDFNTSVALGSWPGAYSSKWGSYMSGSDTSRLGRWDSVKTVSVSGGLADLYLHSENGTPLSSAIFPNNWGQTYGRFSLRFKVDSGLSGWKSAWLLWPDDGVWPAHGEMDWPEGELNGTMMGFMHYATASGGQDWFNSSVAFASGWHTATTDWTPGSVKYYLDGNLIGTSTKQVSSYPMHWVLQSETSGGSKPSTSGHIKIDWAVVYARA